MKKTTQRTVKILSSFAVIAMVLIATVAMPVLAADANGNYKLSEFPCEISSNDQIVTFRYTPENVVPLLRIVDANGDFVTTISSDVATFKPRELSNACTSKVTIEYHPMGSLVVQSSKTGLIDISDFKSYSAFQITSTFGIKAYHNGGLAPMTYRAYWSLFYYDANRNYISSVKAPVQEYSVDSTSAEFRFYAQANSSIPENAKYLGTRCSIAVVPSSIFTDSTFIQISTYEPLNFSVDVDSVIANTVTMNLIESNTTAIKNGIDDLNETMLDIKEQNEILINGKDEWHDKTQDTSDKVSGKDKESQDVMDSIDEGTDLNKILPGDAKQPDELNEYLTNWKQTSGWQQWKYLLSPIMNNQYVIQLLWVLIAFINISVLLIGR